MPRLVLLPAISLMAVAMACTSSDDPTAEPTPTPITPEAALENSRNAMAEVQQFEFELTHPEGATSFPGGINLQRADGAVIGPDRMRVDAEATVFGGVFVDIQAVVIGEQTWMTNPLNGSWSELEAGNSPFNSLDPAQLVSNVLSQLENVSYPESGPSTSGPIILEGTVNSQALDPLVGIVQEGSVLDVTLSLERDTFRLTEARITGKLQPEDEENFVRLIRLSGFDSAITIEPPL